MNTYEGTLAKLSSFLLELLDGTRVDTTTLVDQVTGGGRLAGIDVADNDDVDVGLVLLTVRGSASGQVKSRVDGQGQVRNRKDIPHGDGFVSCTFLKDTRRLLRYYGVRRGTGAEEMLEGWIKEKKEGKVGGGRIYVLMRTEGEGENFCGRGRRGKSFLWRGKREASPGHVIGWWAPPAKGKLLPCTGTSSLSTLH